MNDQLYHNEIYYDNINRIDDIQYYKNNIRYDTNVIEYDILEHKYEVPVLQFPTDINYELAHNRVIYDVAQNDNI